MDVVHTKKALRDLLGEARAAHTIGVVPTMGNLHRGHLSLVRAGRARCSFSVVTIFVNPMQFGPDEDYASYPRTLDADAERLAAEQVDVIFAPTNEEIYPDGREDQTRISVPKLANTLCGESRPGHFDGVATVVAKLFNIVQPDVAFFGEKDWQQLTLIKTMVRQLDMPLDVAGIPTERHENGLALSSRNQYLTATEIERAPVLYRTLCDIEHAIGRGARNYNSLEKTGSLALQKAGFRPDYVAIRDAHTLETPNDRTRQLRILAAAHLGAARLIDNVGVDLAV